MEGANQVCPHCGSEAPGGVCPSHGAVGTDEIGPGVVLRDRFRVERQLGQPWAFLGRRVDTGEGVVIVLLADERLAENAATVAERFRASKAAERFRKKGLPLPLDFGVEPVAGRAFIVLPYGGGPLEAVTNPEGRALQAAALFVQLATQLVEGRAHEPRRPKKRSSAARWSTWTRRLVFVGFLLLLPLIYLGTSENHNPRPTSVGLRRDGVQRHSWHEYLGRPPDRSSLRREYEAKQRELLGGEERVEIISKPEGAAVHAGPKLVGSTPVEVERPEKGARRSVILKKEGYLDKHVSITASSPNPLRVQLFKSGSGHARDLVGDALDSTEDEEKDRVGRDPLMHDPLEREGHDPLDTKIGRDPLNPVPPSPSETEPPDYDDEEM